MCFRFLYLLVTRGLAWLRLSRCEEAWKCAEILLLRHQLTLLRRQVDVRPKMTWADRALLAVLVGVIPRVRRAGLRLVVTPDTVLRWHRAVVRRRWAEKSRSQRPGRRPCAVPKRPTGGARKRVREDRRRGCAADLS